MAWLAAPAGTHLAGQTQYWFQITNGQIVMQWSAVWEWRDRRTEACPEVRSVLRNKDIGMSQRETPV